MPSQYRIRNYQENSFYHIYNKGIGKSNIFLNDDDYEKFLEYLEIYLAPKDAANSKKIPKRLLSKNLSSEIQLIAYLFLPNHFHLILKQSTNNGISKLMKQLNNGFTFYFNKKYENNGPVFAGKFKSVKLDSDENLLSSFHYLHTHPGILWLADNIKDYPWSSYHEYLQSKPKLVSKDYILSRFETFKDFEKFIKENKDPKKRTAETRQLLIDL